MTTTLDPRTVRAADWTALGCAVRVVVQSADDLPVAREILADELDAVDRACSRFRLDSELSLLGTGAEQGQPVAVSPLLADAVDAALYAASVTDGDVDPTVGSAMRDIGYDRDFANIVPRGGTLRVVERPVPGWRRIALDRQRLTLQVPAGVRLDLGATAKALAADRAAAQITRAVNGRGVLVSLGGDIAIGGVAPEAGWQVRVQDVTGSVGDAPEGPAQQVALQRGGLATSSTAARRWVRGGRTMHHILDPRTGVPVASTWRTVTVAAPTCLEANIASTAAIVRGLPAVDWLTGLGFAARLVAESGVVTTLPGWPDAESVTT